MKKILTILAVLVLLVIGFYALNAYIYNEKQADTYSDYKEASYFVSGKPIKLGEEYKYFGNEVTKDVDGDGLEDKTFLIYNEIDGVQEFYVVAAINTEEGYVGSTAMLLDRDIAPQTTESADGLQVLVNYATKNPSVGKSVWLKFDKESMQFGEVVQNFEGEADPSKMTLGMKKWNWIRSEYNDGRVVIPKMSGKFTLTFNTDGTFGASTDCNGLGGNYVSKDSYIVFSNMISTLMYCEGSQENDFRNDLNNSTSHHFTSRGELILDLKFDSGSVIFN